MPRRKSEAMKEEAHIDTLVEKLEKINNEIKNINIVDEV